MKRAALLLLLFLPVSCTTERPHDEDLLRPRTWSAPHDGLSIRLGLEVTTVAPGDVLPVKIFIHAMDSGAKPAHLLDGRFVYTFVPTDGSTGRSAISTFQSFSGGGGVDYTGRVPGETQIAAPSAEGQYLLFATMLSTQDDIKRFLMTARVSAASGPWWIGTMSTPAISITVRDGAAVRTR